jgi:SulP family sulfate permease
VTTFLATLALPIQAALGIGIALSAILYLYESAADVSVVELVRRDDGRLVECKPPDRVRSEDVVVLDVYGALFFAGARRLERLLPDSAGSRRAGVVLRLRSQQRAGATLIEVLTTYADKLATTGGVCTSAGSRAR